MKVLVFGGRDFHNYALVKKVLDQVRPSHIVHGAAGGADSLGGRYAREHNIPCTPYPAFWKRMDPRTGRTYTDRRAGINRNKRMLADSKPDLLIGFPGGTGTAHMRDHATSKGYRVVMIPPSGETPAALTQSP